MHNLRQEPAKTPCIETDILAKKVAGSNSMVLFFVLLAAVNYSYLVHFLSTRGTAVDFF